jgi:hypothetical protein
MQTWLVCQMIFPPIAALAAATVMARREGGFRREQLLRTIMVFGLAAGTTTHVLMRLVSDWASSTSTAHDSFWTALTVVDPAIAVAIVFAPRTGMAAAIALMICDVAVNVTVTGGFAGWPLWFQSAFGLFVLAATPYCWTRAGQRASALLQIRQ